MHLGGVLERAPQPRPDQPAESDDSTADPTPKGKGGIPASKAVASRPARTTKRVKGRTVYIADDLFERIIVQAHRRDVTISDYVCLLLDRHVPDHRVVRSGPATAADQGETDAGVGT